MIDIFQYSNMYTVKPAIQKMSRDESVSEECGLYVTRLGKWRCVPRGLLLTGCRLPTPVVAGTTGTILGSSTGNHGPPMGNRQRPSRERDRYPTLRHFWDHQGFPPACPSMADHGGVCAASFRQRYRDCAGFRNGFAD